MVITLEDVHGNWLNWFHFLILVESPLVILICRMAFLSPFLDVIRMSMSPVFPLDPATLWNCLTAECFHLASDLNGFKSRVNTPSSFGLFLNSFPICFPSFSSFSCNSMLSSGCPALHGVKPN